MLKGYFQRNNRSPVFFWLVFGFAFPGFVFSQATVQIQKADAADDQIVFDAGDDYTIRIPGEWKEIPKEVLDQFGAMASQAAGQSVTYEYGYQLSANEDWFEYPYVLVQVNRSGRISEGQMKNYRKIDSGIEEGMKKAESAAGELLSNASLGESIYDSGTHILWSSVAMDVQEAGRVKGLMAVKLTDYGSIHFFGYALEDEFEQYKGLYSDMVHSIQVGEKDRYKPRFLDNAPTLFGINLGQVAIAALIGGLIGGLSVLFRKKSA